MQCYIAENLLITTVSLLFNFKAVAVRKKPVFRKCNPNLTERKKF